MKTVVGLTVSFVVFAAAACGGGSTQPPQAPPPAPVATVVPAPEPEPEPVTEEADAGTEAADATTADAEPETTQLRPSSNRPMTIIMDPTTPQTVAYDGAVVRLSNGAELRLPAGSLSDQRNIVFFVDQKAKGTKGKVGDVYQLRLEIPGRSYVMGQARPSEPVDSAGPNFVMKLPLPQGMESANLAVEQVTQGANQRTKSEWRVIPMTKLETADPNNRAVFELRSLPDGYLHLTSQAPAQ